MKTKKISLIILSIIFFMAFFAGCSTKSGTDYLSKLKSESSVAQTTVRQTAEPTTAQPTTAHPTTAEQTTQEPTTEEPTTEKVTEAPEEKSGSSKEESEARESEVSNNYQAQNQTNTYILNTNTKKFHYSYCDSVNKIKDSNKEEYHGSRDEVISMGYEPCKRCNP